ncbi:hypothetical protein JCM10213_003620 [Rhodosporidiobolus nylandii]
MPSSSRIRFECAICLHAGGTEDAWAAPTSCGHIFHEECLKQCKSPQPGISICPFRCPDRQVTFLRPDRTTRSHRIANLPLLRLYLPENQNPPSSDALEASQAQFYEPAQRPPKEVPSAEDEEDDIEDDEADSGEEDEVTRLRNELREALNKIRELNNVRGDYDVLARTAEGLEQRLAQRDAEVGALQAQIADYVRPEQALERIAELERKLKRTRADLRAEEETREREGTRARTEYSLLEGDFGELKIKYKELERRLEIAGESGQTQIKELSAEVDKKDRQILRLEGEVDKANLDRQNTEVRATKLIEQATAENKRLQQQLEEEKRTARIASGANVDLRRKNAKLKERLTKKAIIDDDEADEDGLYNPGAASPPPAGPSKPTSRLFARTSSRSRISPSPFSVFDDDDDVPGPAFKVNNNSRLLASPTKRKRVRSVMDDDAYDVSNGSIETPAQEGDDDDSDLEILEPQPKGKAPLSSRPSLANARPLSSALSSSSFSTFASMASSAPSQCAGGWGVKKPALSQSKADKHLPSLAHGTLDFGPKNKKKLRK